LKLNQAESNKSAAKEMAQTYLDQFLYTTDASGGLHLYEEEIGDTVAFNHCLFLHIALATREKI
jgi:hypothetical protein